MKVRGLDGRTYNLNLTGRVPLLSDERPRSSLHLRARALLAELFPNDARLEEVPLPGTGLWADFFLPLRGLLIEVQGQQHERQCFFHEHELDFARGLSRDIRKAQWAELNDFCLVELPHDESDDQWRRRILG